MLYKLQEYISFETAIFRPRYLIANNNFFGQEIGSSVDPVDKSERTEAKRSAAELGTGSTNKTSLVLFVLPVWPIIIINKLYHFICLQEIKRHQTTK